MIDHPSLPSLLMEMPLAALSCLYWALHSYKILNKEIPKRNEKEGWPDKFYNRYISMGA